MKTLLKVPSKLINSVAVLAAVILVNHQYSGGS
jgi:hypothetical protein